MSRVLLLMATRTYRARAFLEAARRLGVEVVVGSERRQALASRAPRTTVRLDFRRPAQAARQVAEFARECPLDAIVGVDDDTTLIAAMAARIVGLPHNSVESLRIARDKYRTRCVLAAAGLPSPSFQRLSLEDDPFAAAAQAPYPCVLKPIALSASRGVIRADTPKEFVAAFKRIAALISTVPPTHRYMLVESFLPGPEVALEGLLAGGELHVLALFDKPDPLDGPFFEETLYITPARLPASEQRAIAEMAARAACALGLWDGPLHAELRLAQGGPFVVEVAARTIGGLCSNTLRFGTGVSLEELVLRHAIRVDLGTLERERRAAGVMMLPIPRAGILRKVLGRRDAEQVSGIERVAITIPLGQPVVPLPEGDRYLGFVFARGDTPEQAESALREAHRRLGFVITTTSEEAEEEVCVQASPATRLLPLLPAAR